MTIDLAPLLDNWRNYLLGWGREYADSAIFRSGVRLPGFNGVVRRDERAFGTQLADARQRLDGVPWHWRVAPDDPSNTGARLLARGARLVATQPIMAARIADLVPGVPPVGFRVREANDVAHWVTAGARHFGMPEAFRPAMIAGEQAMPGAITRFDGRVEDRVVATAALFVSDGVAGVYAVGVAEQYRRRGIGAAITRAALDAAARQGIEIATLQSRDAAQALYARMGFRIATRCDIYSL